VSKVTLNNNNNNQTIKVIWHNTASPPQMDGSIVFVRWRQCAHMGGHIGATWQIRLNLYFLQHTQVDSPNGKSIGSAVSAQLTAESPYTLQWATFSPKIVPAHGGFGPPSISWFLEPDLTHNPNCITISSAVFPPQSVPILYNGRPFPQKLPLPRGIWTHLSLQTKCHVYRFSRFCTDDHRVSLYFTIERPFPPSKLPFPIGGPGPPSNTWFPGPTRVLNPKGISIDSTILARLTSVTDWPTDRQTTLLSW